MYAKLRNNLVQAQNINWMVSVSRMARKGGCGDNDEKKFPDQDKVHVRCVIWVEWKERRKKLLATESLGMRSRIFDSANSYQHTSRREILVCECISKHFAHCAGQKQTNEKREKWEPTKKKETGLRWNFVGFRRISLVQQLLDHDLYSLWLFQEHTESWEIFGRLCLHSTVQYYEH